MCRHAKHLLIVVILAGVGSLTPEAVARTGADAAPAPAILAPANVRPESSLRAVMRLSVMFGLSLFFVSATTVYGIAAMERLRERSLERSDDPSGSSSLSYADSDSILVG